MAKVQAQWNVGLSITRGGRSLWTISSVLIAQSSVAFPLFGNGRFQLGEVYLSFEPSDLK